MMLALVYEKLSDKEKAKRTEYMDKARQNYTKVLELDPNNYRANYNLGIFYYNSAVAIINDMPVDEDLDKMMKVQDECVEIFKKAEPYMLKAESLDPRKIETLEGLSGIYFALNEPEKSNAYKEKIAQLKK
jgi:tetratricopeptide (TPR) repeat protein